MLTIHTRRGPALAAVAVLAVTAAGVAHGAGGGGNGIVNFGPYHLHGQDTSTCGNVWANVVGRHIYHVYPRAADGSYLIRAEGDLRLRSIAAVAIGACDNGQPNDGSTIGHGVRVNLVNTVVLKVTGGTLNPDATCAAPCGPDDMVHDVFGPSATFQLLSWTGVYSTACNGSYFFQVTPDGVEHDAGNITGDAHAC
jgi:hypothetical protein